MWYDDKICDPRFKIFQKNFDILFLSINNIFSLFINIGTNIDAYFQ